MPQLDVYDVLRVIAIEEMTEDDYARIEREGIRLDSFLCPECPDPGLCAAERACTAGGDPADARWDEPA